ncbi:MAG: glycosyltransferase family 39 protein, partial [Vulcanimicrobiaceae bacterium]
MATQRLSRAPLLLPLVVVGCVTLARLVVAAFHPITEDEAYYWTWSLHPAFGYVDHPPMVAWLIGSTAWLPRTGLFIRLPFIVCEGVAALAAAAAALEMSGSQRSALVAAILVAFIPNVKLMIGEALPDPPFLMFWALAIFFAARTLRGGARSDWVLLGLALGGAMLSRVFGWALFFGVAATFLTGGVRVRAPFAVSCAIALALLIPWIAWNASHEWVNLLFTVRDRQSFRAVSATHAFNNMTVRFLIFDAA